MGQPWRQRCLQNRLQSGSRLSLSAFEARLHLERARVSRHRHRHHPHPHLCSHIGWWPARLATFLPIWYWIFKFMANNTYSSFSSAVDLAKPYYPAKRAYESPRMKLNLSWPETASFMCVLQPMLASALGKDLQSCRDCTKETIFKAISRSRKTGNILKSKKVLHFLCHWLVEPYLTQIRLSVCYECCALDCIAQRTAICRVSDWNLSLGSWQACDMASQDMEWAGEGHDACRSLGSFSKNTECLP